MGTIVYLLPAVKAGDDCDQLKMDALIFISAIFFGKTYSDAAAAFPLAA